MRIAFIHSCLEPGRDGVGDYTRLLAAECARQGHPACIVSLNDPFIHGEPSVSVHKENCQDAPCLRIGPGTPWPDRIRVARAFLNAFEPDRISLQFVCYGWHPKGIARGIGPRLGAVIGSTPLQMLFHETWIGVERGASWKDRVTGMIQSHYVLRTLQELRPFAVHTTNPAWQALLARNAVHARLLPLFGLIPIVAQPDFAWLEDELRAHEIGVSGSDHPWLFAMFGSLHPVWPPEPLFSHLRRLSNRCGRGIAIVAAGRMHGGELLWDSLVARYSGDFAFCKLGERPPAQISELLQFADFGIAATPWSIIGKSAAVSTMLDHGLPVIVNRDELQFSFDVPPLTGHSPLLDKMGNDLAERLPEMQRCPPRSTLPDVAAQFIGELGSL